MGQLPRWLPELSQRGGTGNAWQRLRSAVRPANPPGFYDEDDEDEDYYDLEEPDPDRITEDDIELSERDD